MGYAKQLERMGHAVTSRWITGVHEIPGKREGDDYTVEERAHFSAEDLKDLDEAECIVGFTEFPDAPANKGGRHVEFGYAIAKGKMLYVVGPRENVFHCLPDVICCADFDALASRIYDAL